MSDDCEGAYWDGFKMGCTLAAMLLALALVTVVLVASIVVGR